MSQADEDAGNVTISRGQRLLPGAKDDDPMVEVDVRGRLSLGKYIGGQRRFLVTNLGEGALLLTPAIVVVAGDPLFAEVEQALAESAATGRRRGRPQRRQ